MYGSFRLYGKSLLLVLVCSVIAFFFPSACVSSEMASLYSVSKKMFEQRVATADPENWRFVFLGDNRGNDVKFKEILQWVRELDPLFILHGGDIVENGNEEELAHFRTVVQSVKELPPLFVVRGNHERNSILFEKVIGPLNFVIDSKRLDMRVVAVDNSQYVLNEHELLFLSRTLDQKPHNQFVAMHIPPKSERWPKHSFDMGKNALLQMMAERNVKMGLFSHIHLFDADTLNGIPLIVSGGAGSQLAWFGYTGDTMYHIVIVDIVKGQVTYRVERFDSELMPSLDKKSIKSILKKM